MARVSVRGVAKHKWKFKIIHYSYCIVKKQDVHQHLFVLEIKSTNDESVYKKQYFRKSS